MSTRMRNAVIAVAAAAVSVVGLGGAAQADSVVYTNGQTITALPAKAVLSGNPVQSVTVKLAVPAGLSCVNDVTTQVVGQTAAIVLGAKDCTTVPGFVSWLVSAAAGTAKGEAVVKFVMTAPAKGRSVGSLNVKVNPKAGSGDSSKPAAAVSGAEISVFPAKAVLLGGKNPAEFVTAKVALPSGVNCPADVTTKTVGQRNAVTVTGPVCSTGFATFTVTANAISHKRHAVVKFIATNPTDKSKTVSTLNVSVNKGAKPAKGNGHS